MLQTILVYLISFRCHLSFIFVVLFAFSCSYSYLSLVHLSSQDRVLFAQILQFLNRNDRSYQVIRIPARETALSRLKLIACHPKTFAPHCLYNSTFSLQNEQTQDVKFSRCSNYKIFILLNIKIFASAIAA